MSTSEAGSTRPEGVYCQLFVSGTQQGEGVVGPPGDRCGRFAGTRVGGHTTGNLPAARHPLAAEAVPQPLRRVCCPLRGRLRPPAGTLPSAAHHPGRRLFQGCGPHPLHRPRLPSRVLPSFSCKVFHPCPSCSQKRTLLFGEYLNERLLLRLPHRQMVFTFPKVLHQYGEIARFHPPLHAIVLEGGFDGKGRFVHIPRLDLGRLSQYFRANMVNFLEYAAVDSLRFQRGFGAHPGGLAQDPRGAVAVHRPAARLASEASCCSTCPTAGLAGSAAMGCTLPDREVPGCASPTWCVWPLRGGGRTISCSLRFPAGPPKSRTPTARLPPGSAVPHGLG
jgi:hypothetical protein